MDIKLSQIFIEPFTIDNDNERFNTYEHGLDDSDIDGWNVHSWGLFNCNAEIIHDKDFDDLGAAISYAKTISRQFNAEIAGMPRPKPNSALVLANVTGALTP